jgi:hypothetical protein
MGVNPATIQVVHPTTIPFNILGGLPDYTIFPSVAGVIDLGANPLVTSAPTFTGSTVCPGDVNIQIVDADGKTTTSAVTVVIDLALGVLPATQTLVDPILTDTATYDISGGVAPYDAISSHPTLVAVSVTDSTLTATVNGIPAEDTTITITVLDACNNSVDVELVLDVPEPVEPAALLITPTPLLISENASFQVFGFTITGGVPGYTVVSSNANLAFNDNGASPGDGVKDPDEGGTWAVANDGDSISVTIPADDIVPSNTDITLTVSDSGGSPAATATITIQDTLPVTLVINPNTRIIDELGAFQVLTFQITGGSPNYTVISSDANLAFNDNGASPGDGVKDPDEDGTWTGITDGGTFNVTIPSGDIVPGNTDVLLFVTDTATGNTIGTITIQDAI